MSLFDELKAIEDKECIDPAASLNQKFMNIKNHFLSRENTIQIMYPRYTLHNQKHSEEIVKILTSFKHKKLLKKDLLNKYEIFLLISSAYLHDIGMMIIKDEDKVNDCIDLNGIRDKHHLRSYEYIIENKDILNLNEFEAFNLALICKGHRREDLLNNDIYKTIPCPDDPDKTIRIDLLAALLRIADELDMSHKRIAQSLKEFLNKFQSFDTITHLHWYKHYYSNGFLPCFIEQNTKPIKLSIPVSFDLPAGWDKNSFVIPFIINHLHNEIEYLNQVFIKHHFTMHIQEADIRINNSLQSIPKEIYNNIIDWALKKIKIRVLIVDDDPLIRKEFTYVIRDLGYEVEEAKDCKDALEKIKSSKFHLILLDLKMPDLNNRTSKDAGIDLLKLIKNNKRDNIIVIISAFEESQLIIDSLRNGADDFIIKDMLNEEFKNRVNQALKRNLHLIIDK